MISYKLIALRRAGLFLSTAFLLSISSPGQGQYAYHQRHVDSGNIHKWWDTNVHSAFGNGGLARIDDLNGDGHPEVLIGLTGITSASTGKVLILSGREGRAILATLTGSKAGGAFGHALATIGDVNGDQIEDFIVASPNAMAGKTAQAGIVQLYSGKLVANKATLLHTFNGATTKGQFGYSVAGPGDVDGDGFPDIAIGEPGDISKVSGAVYVYSGNPKHKKGAYALIYRQAGVQVGERYGLAIAGAGDVNNDSRSDVIVGAPLWNGPGGSNHGRAEALSWKGTSSPRVFQLAAGRGLQPNDNYGLSVSKVGLIAGNASVIVGAPYDDTQAKDAGRATVLSPGKPWIPAISILGNSASDLFGFRVASCGDVDLDGNADFAVSAPFDDPVSRVHDSGSVFVYSYSPRTKKTTQITHRFHPNSYRSYGLRYGVSLVSAGDVDQDDFGDLLVGCDHMYYYAGWRRGWRNVYLESPVEQRLYADRGHAIVSQGAIQTIYSIQAGTKFANQLMIFLGSGPHNTGRSGIVPTKIAKFTLPIQWGTPWFDFSLSGALNPVLLLLDAKGNGSLTMSLPFYNQKPPLPLKVYSAGLMIKMPPSPFEPSGVTNAIPLWIR